MLYVDIEKKLKNFTLRVKFQTDRGNLALLGESGAGKSLTLKCIAGIEKPDRGEIILDSVTLFDSKNKINLPPQKRRVGYLFQDYALFPDMTVLGNIKAGLRGTGTKDQDAQELIERFRLSGLEDRMPKSLSGGEKQRVALARIFASQPKLLLLDEPFSSLDSFLKWQLSSELKEAVESFDGDVITVTHDIDEAAGLCDDVVVITKGVSSSKQNIHDLMDSPNTTAAAKLTGIRNFSRITKIRNDSAFCENWGAKLTVKSSLKNAEYICIKDTDIFIADDDAPNTLICVMIQENADRRGYSYLFKSGDSVISMRSEIKLGLIKNHKYRLLFPEDKLIPLKGDKQDV